MAGEEDIPAAGTLDDRVRLYLNGNEIPITESYEIQRAVLTQPSTFTARLGWGGVIKELLTVLVPNTPFELKINDAPMFTGVLDDIDASGEVGATEITIYGRDALAPLHDGFIEAEQDVSSLTYADLVKLGLDATIGKTYSIVYDNAANRKLTTGIGVTQTGAPPGDPQQKGGPTAKQLKLHIGERWYEAIKRHLDRVGLFLWADAEGNFVLSAPNSAQPPAYKILRRRGQSRNAVSAISAHYKNHTVGRYTSADMFARSGKGKAGRNKIKGVAVDDEMAAYGFKRPLVLHDTNVTNPEQADFYAKRKLAESRRMGWSLSYTVAGHTIPSLIDSGARAVWCPDTVVSVEDEEFGITGDFYIERVAYRRNPKTTCDLTLSRDQDLIFGKVDGE